MSAPQDRLLPDVEAERMRAGAMDALFSPHPISIETRQLAACVIVLAQDRQARIELGIAEQIDAITPENRR